MRINCVPRSARWRCMMRFVEDQQTARMKSPQPISQRAGVGLVDQQTLRYKETRIRTPRIDSESTLPPYALQIVFVENLEPKTKTALQLFPPLQDHGGRAGDN